MSKPVRFLLLCASGVLLLLLVWWMRKPVMLRVWEGPLRSHAKFTLFGPLRNRAPEAVAETFLASVRDGHCVEALRTTGEAPGEIADDCQKEAADPIREWELINRLDAPGLVRLTYYYSSPKVPFSSRELVELQLKPEQAGWRVFTYGRMF